MWGIPIRRRPRSFAEKRIPLGFPRRRLRGTRCRIRFLGVVRSAAEQSLHRSCRGGVTTANVRRDC